jgi:ribosomal protein S18 acetylase RimI-like enzyme
MSLTFHNDTNYKQNFYDITLINYKVLKHNYKQIYSNIEYEEKKQLYKILLNANEINEINKHMLQNTTLVKIDNKTVAFYTLYQREMYIYIDDIRVDPEYQCQKIGSQILDKLIKNSQESNMPLVLDVNIKNSIAISIYIRLGFKKVKNNDDGYIVMIYDNNNNYNNNNYNKIIEYLLITTFL